MDYISVIVPIYNADYYLAKCLNSILAQTYEALEVLLVNDGSTDESLEICETYCEIDHRVKVINQTNQGVAVARNTGLKAATGKYIAFVDPDDWLETDMYERLLEVIKASPYPIALCDYFKDTKKRSSSKGFEFKDKELDLEGIKEKMIPDMIGIEDIVPRYGYIMGCVWRGLFEANFIKENGLHFEPGITIMEDLVFMVQALLKTKGISILHEPLYHYVQNPKSILHSYNEKMWFDQIKVHQLLEESLRGAGLEEKMRNRLDFRYVSMVLAALKNEVLTHNDQELKERVLNMKEICKDDKLKCVLERIKPIQKPSIKEAETVKNKEKQQKVSKKLSGKTISKQKLSKEPLTKHSPVKADSKYSKEEEQTASSLIQLLKKKTKDWNMQKFFEE